MKWHKLAAYEAQKVTTSIDLPLAATFRAPVLQLLGAQNEPAPEERRKPNKRTLYPKIQDAIE